MWLWDCKQIRHIQTNVKAFQANCNVKKQIRHWEVREEQMRLSQGKFGKNPFNDWVNMLYFIIHCYWLLYNNAINKWYGMTMYMIIQISKHLHIQTSIIAYILNIILGMLRLRHTIVYMYDVFWSIYHGECFITGNHKYHSVYC